MSFGWICNIFCFCCRNVEARKAKEKAAMGGFLKKASLYNDKEEEEARKLREKKEKELAKEEALKKRKKMWEDEVRTHRRIDPTRFFGTIKSKRKLSLLFSLFLEIECGMFSALLV